MMTKVSVVLAAIGIVAVCVLMTLSYISYRSSRPEWPKPGYSSPYHETPTGNDLFGPPTRTP